MAAPVMFDDGADTQRRQALRRMRGFALSLLVFAAVVYVVTLHRSDPWTFVHATAEAAMVGAIADWFAVTALFRHPLGLPIPHTAIIPTRKAALGQSLKEFITQNFLGEDVIRQRVADAQVSRRVGTWLQDPANSTRVINEASSLLRTGLEKITDAEVANLIESELLRRLADEPLSEIAGRLLQDVVEEGAHHGLVDLALDEAHRWLLTNPDKVATILVARAPWWTPQWLDEKVTSRIHEEALAWVAEIRDDPRHDARQALDGFLVQLASDLQHDPDTMERAERLKERVLSQPQVVVTATSLWRGIRRALVTTLEDDESPLRARSVDRLAAYGERLVSDDELRGRMDARAADAAAFLVGRYGAELTTVITDTIDRWDGKEAATRIELFVGRDLQFIRINGTLVGGLAGLIIYTLSRLL